MPKRTDIKSILIIGAGPIVIGQACEFDYSGHTGLQGAPRRGLPRHPGQLQSGDDHDRPGDGRRDLSRTDHPPRSSAKIIEKERPDALLPTMGGQTALNCALSLRKMGVLDEYGVEMIGAKADAIDKAEDRELFREAMAKIGLATPKSRLAHNMIEALQALDEIGLPAIIRPSFTLGGTGGGIAYNREEYLDIIESGVDASPTNEVPGRGIRARLEGVRDGGRPRQGRTTASSCARSRTSIRWACTPAIRSPSRRR